MSVERREIRVDQLSTHVTAIWNEWLLLTAGSFPDGEFNPMTVSWGMMGVIWNKPVVQVVVRPTRHTFRFLEGGASFTLCAFPKKYQPVLAMLGAKSGRDIDKVAESGLTPVASAIIAAPGFDEASLILECRKLAFGDMDPSGFVDESIDKMYNGDYHRWYIGEVVAIRGTEQWGG